MFSSFLSLYVTTNVRLDEYLLQNITLLDEIDHK